MAGAKEQTEDSGVVDPCAYAGIKMGWIAAYGVREPVKN